MRSLLNIKNIRKALAAALVIVLCAAPACVFAAGKPGLGFMKSGPSFESEALEVTESSNTSNSAESLKADYSNATEITVSDSESDVKIKDSGTYIVTGSCLDGNITVKKGTAGVVLVLKDLDLTSKTGAALLINKGAEVKIIVSGKVTLTDAEDIEDEDSEGYDGAAIKIKAGASVVLSGDGALTLNGNCEHGIKVSDASFIIDGELPINITGVEDGINSGADVTIKSGTINISAGADGIKSDYILTIGSDGSAGPVINVEESSEGLEGAIVNIYSGTINVNAKDDAINAANSELSGYTFSINIMGGEISLSSDADGLDSNGNINILGGHTTILKSASDGGGEGGVDYEGRCYVAEGCLTNPYGVTFDSGTGGKSDKAPEPQQKTRSFGDLINRILNFFRNLFR